MDSKWILTSEECPPADVMVLCWNGFQFYTDFCHRYTEPSVGIEWDDEDETPTHWMHLPKEPKK